VNVLYNVYLDSLKIKTSYRVYLPPGSISGFNQKELQSTGRHLWHSCLKQRGNFVGCNSDCISSNDRKLRKGFGRERVWSYVVIFQRLFGGTEESHKNPHTE
jgi:hypothetical protein